MYTVNSLLMLTNVSLLVCPLFRGSTVPTCMYVYVSVKNVKTPFHFTFYLPRK